MNADARAETAPGPSHKNITAGQDVSVLISLSGTPEATAPEERHLPQLFNIERDIPTY